MRLHRISIVVDEAGHPEGAVVTHDYDTRGAAHTPIDVSPFDTIEDVLTACRERLTIQLRLWEDAG